MPLYTDTVTIQVTDSAGRTAQAVFTIPVNAATPQAATPTFSPPAGTYSSAQTVTISCATPAATIYYTTNGTTPTTSSPVYTGPITVSASETVQAIATASGYSQSAVGSAAYTISSGGATLVFSYPNFSSTANLQTAASAVFSGGVVELMPEGSGHAAGAVWYTTLQPTGSFTTQFTFQWPSMPTAQAVVAGMTFIFQNTTSALNPSAFGDHYSSDANCAGYGAYNPADYSSQNPPFNAIGVKFDANPVVNAWLPSSIGPSTTGLYVNNGTFNGLWAAQDMAPYGINLYNGEIFQSTIVYDDGLQLLTMVTVGQTSGAQIRQSWPVSVPHSLSSSTGYVGFGAGTAGTGAEGINLLSWKFWTGFNTRLTTPTFSPAAGQYSSTQNVTITYPSGATCYYTTNGLLPTSASTQYTGPFNVSTNKIVQAVAIESGFTDSLVGSATYQINTANPINFPSGFAANDGVILVGTAVLSSSAIELTNTAQSFTTNGGGTVNGGVLESGAAWFAAPVNIQSGWSTTFQLKFTSASANGMAFVIQNPPAAYSSNSQTASWSSGPNVVAGNQGSGGYGGNQNSNGWNGGILNSIAVYFDLFNSPPNVGLYTNGATPAGSQVSMSSSGINFSSSTPINVTLSYSGTTLTITATQGANTFGPYNLSTTLNIPSTVGANTAYVGFTAGTGGQSANMFVNSWTFTP